MKVTMIAAVMIFVLALGCYLFFRRLPSDPYFIVNYARNKKGKKDASLIIRRNGLDLLVINPDVSLPLASTVKIMLAIEYARQVSNGIIDENETVPKEDLLKFYIDNTDGGSHKSWVEHMKDQDAYTLREIVIGMIAFSSNANTEFLLEKLGMEAINRLPIDLNLNNHSVIYPIVSALYIPSYLRVKKQMTNKNELVTYMREMSTEEYIQHSLYIHEHLSKGETHDYMNKMVMDYELQRIWSDRLPASSALDYVKIMQMINSRDHFPPDMQACLEEILGYALYLNEENKKWLDYGGFKGGSTLFVFTYACYATDKEGNQTEIVFLSNNANPLHAKKLQLNGNRFILQTLTDETFRKKIVE